MNSNQQKLAKEWFNSANSDLLYAEAGLKEKTIFPQVAFLSQQAVEKLLKGFLILNGVNPPRIHELPKLLDECVKIDTKFESLRDACELLSGFYVETRYPPDIPEFTKADIAKAFSEAKLIKEAVELLVK